MKPINKVLASAILLFLPLSLVSPAFSQALQDQAPLSQSSQALTGLESVAGGDDDGSFAGRTTNTDSTSNSGTAREISATAPGDVGVIPPDELPSMYRELNERLNAIEAMPEKVYEQLKLLLTPINSQPDSGAQPPSPAQKTWIVPSVDGWFDEEKQMFTNRTRIRFLNPGDEMATVQCMYFDAFYHDANFKHDLTATKILESGRDAACYGRHGVKGWMLVSSDRPILVHAWVDREQVDGQALAAAIQAYPIDCQYPEGIEYACQFVTE